MDNRSCEALRLDNQLCFALYSTSLAMNKLYKPLLQALGLTYPQYLIMLVLWEENGITATELGKRLVQDLGALSPVIKRLEAQGLLTRQRSPDDERKIQLRLTDAGKDLRQRAGTIPGEVLCASGLDVEAALKLKAQLEEVRKTLQELI
ncbi:MarR family transcriptional regulator [Zobellella endophytica]|uniref:MarR family transcriptional regulator n=1 Tax=Zobellella endophytica TaxID=2116700 RepID=A0A2P7R0J0_9GAMM|nr:MarR family transcriptional regulator [Zobellella endophytica]PSJ43716.1 MarR family transcriptional regulator [Zobellella endophytica]